MTHVEVSRRSFLTGLAGAGVLAAAERSGTAFAQSADDEGPSTKIKKQMAATRSERMNWWHEAKFGMFVHWGLYSLVGQHEWSKEVEGIPLAQYETLARHFKPKSNAARDWARLAKAAGQKYMVMTTKHHEGFCHWDT